MADYNNNDIRETQIDDGQPSGHPDRKRKKSIRLVLILIAIAATAVALILALLLSRDFNKPRHAEKTVEPAQSAEEIVSGSDSEEDGEAAQSEGESVSEPVSEETAAPESPQSSFLFSTEDLDGNEVDEGLFDGYKLIMLNFWEPWCGPCVGEMPDLQRLYETYKDRGLLIIGVFATEGMDEDVRAILDETGVKYPIIRSCSAFTQFDTGFVPTTVFMTGSGSILNNPSAGSEEHVNGYSVYVGSRSYESWESVVLEHLGK